jgi:hypothetical protein
MKMICSQRKSILLTLLASRSLTKLLHLLKDPLASDCGFSPLSSFFCCSISSKGDQNGHGCEQADIRMTIASKTASARVSVYPWA